MMKSSFLNKKCKKALSEKQLKRVEAMHLEVVANGEPVAIAKGIRRTTTLISPHLSPPQGAFQHQYLSLFMSAVTPCSERAHVQMREVSDIYLPASSGTPHINPTHQPSYSPYLSPHASNRNVIGYIYQQTRRDPLDTSMFTKSCCK